MTRDEICELAKKHGLALGMQPRPQLVATSESTLGFRRPPGFTPYGRNLLAFASDLIAAERERCAKVAENHDGISSAPVVYVIAEAIRKGETP